MNIIKNIYQILNIIHLKNSTISTPKSPSLQRPPQLTLQPPLDHRWRRVTIDMSEVIAAAGIACPGPVEPMATFEWGNLGEVRKPMENLRQWGENSVLASNFGVVPQLCQF